MWLSSRRFWEQQLDYWTSGLFIEKDVRGVSEKKERKFYVGNHERTLQFDSFVDNWIEKQRKDQVHENSILDGI